jgi:hypothetical protein
MGKRVSKSNKHKSNRRHRRNSRHRKQKKTHTRRTMKGGAFTQQEIQQLQANGFSQYQIESLTDLGVSFNEVMQKINAITNEGSNGFSGNSDDLAEQVMTELLNEHIFENANANVNPNVNVNTYSQPFDTASQGPMELDELNISNMSDSSGYTTEEDFGGATRRKNSKKRRGKKIKKTRKQRGGMCFGNGVGANSYDPNYSIYNTNMLKLFPYKAN